MGATLVAALWAAGWLGFAPVADGRVVINEFMALNNSTFQDVDGDYADWIELLNQGSNTVSLLGWHLTDNASNLTKWTFPDVSLEPGQLLLVVASDKNRRIPGQQLHTNFKLAGEGEYLGLIHPDGITVAFDYSPAYPPQSTDISYGISPDYHLSMVSATTPGRFRIPFPHISGTWMQHPGMDDSGWPLAMGGLGYETVPGPLAPWIQTPIPPDTGSFYTRYTFSLTGNETFDELVLDVRFDDGFAAFLNGIPVAASNAPATLNYTSLATAVRDAAEAVVETRFDLTPVRHVLESGANVLAIHTLNVASNDTDILLTARLTGVSTGEVVALRYFTQPTPGAPNVAGYSGTAAAPDFSVDGGFYTNAQILALTAPDGGAVIRYTLDGSEPTAASPLYTGPLTLQSRTGQPNGISMIPTAPQNTSQQWSWMPVWKPPLGEVFKATVVRARTFAEGKLPSPITTRTYFIDPAMPARYGQLPVISLTSDPKHLFNNLTGIYVPGNLFTGSTQSGNYYQNWEKPMHMEWYEPGGSVGFRQDLGVRIQGNSSPASPHKGLSFFARAEYGQSTVKYPLFAGVSSDVADKDEFKRFMLRAWGSYRGRALLYDPFAQILLDRWDLDLQDYRLCAVFINGEYWGLQELREAVKNSHYLEQTYGIDRNDPGYDVLYGAGPYPEGKYEPSSLTDYSYIDEGDGTNWNQTIAYLNANNMALPQHYAFAQSRIDIDNYILYMVHSAFTVKYDWPNQNEAKFRPRVDDGRFRWLQFDLDHSFHDSWQINMLSGKVFNHNVYTRLQAHPDFRAAFINTYADLMNSDFRRDVMLARFEAMVAEIMPYAPEFHARWPLISGGGDQMSNWIVWLNAMRNNIENRTAYERENVRAMFGLSGSATLTLDVHGAGLDTRPGHVQINRLEITEHTRGVTNGVYPWRGLYYLGVPLRVTAHPADGYRFVAWQGLLDSSNNPAVFNHTTTGTVTAIFEPFDPGDFPLVVSEVMYQPAREDAGILLEREAEFIELHNRGAVPFNLRDISFTHGIRFTFTHDYWLPADGYVVLVNDLEAFAARYDTNAIPIGGVYDGRLDNSGERVRLQLTPFGPPLASFRYNNSRAWPLTAAGAGHSLIPLPGPNQVNERLSHGASWRASAFRHGSPGAADPEPPRDVVLNEIMAHTDNDDPATYPEHDSNDWIELFNTTGQAVPLGHWYLSDRATNLKRWAIPPGTTIDADGWIDFDEVTGFNQPLGSGFALNKAGEQVFLSYLPGTAADRVADAVVFKGQPNHFSLGRYPDGAPHWRTMPLTRGAANAAPLTGLVISEIMAHPAPTAAHPPNNTNDEFVELWNPTDQPIALEDGVGVWRIHGTINLVFPPGIVLGPGEYLALVPFDPQSDAAERSAFEAAYGLTNGQVRLLGPFSGRLPNEGDRVALERPEPPDGPGGSLSWIIVDEALFAPFAPWPTNTSATGRSLRRVDPAAHGNDATAWAEAHFPTPGLPPAKVGFATPRAGERLLLPHQAAMTVLIDEALVAGAVERVVYHVNGAWAGEATAPPYAVPLSAVQTAGPHVLQAVLYDAAGAHPAPPITIEALRVDNADGATGVEEESAWLHGRLYGDGEVAAVFHWGPQDGGTNPAAWAHADAQGTVSEGVFTRPVQGLTLNQRYYYRVSATRDGRTVWAPESATFRFTLADWAHHLRIVVRDLTDADSLVDFPVLVNLSTNIPGFDYGDFALPGGADLRFAASAAGAAFAHEIEHWDPTGVSPVWVRLPLLQPGDNVFHAFWGNPAAQAPSAATNGAVWAAAYARVFHLHGGLADASPEGVTALDIATVAGPGVVAGGRAFNGVDAQFHPQLTTNWYGENLPHMTLSLWVRPVLKDQATAIGQFGGGREWPISIAQSAGQWKFVVSDNAAGNTQHAVRPGEWQQLALVFDQGQARAYLNGVPAATPIPYQPFELKRDLLVGHLNGQTATAYRHEGDVDEVRIADRAHTPAWLRASYLTVASNAWVTVFGEPPRYVDSNTNNLADAWEERYFGSLNHPQGGPEDDYDGDGVSNLEEFIAGTDPTDADDFFRLWLLPAGTNGLEVHFEGRAPLAADGVGGRWYSLEHRTSLREGPGWAGVPAFTNVPGADVTITHVTNVPGAGFYRGRVWIVPGSP